MSTAGSEAFEKLVGTLDYPMFVVTTGDPDAPSGCLVGFASQTSINPPRFLVGISKRNHTFRVAMAADHLAVHLIDRENRALAELFGGKTGDDFDKFAHCAWHTGPQRMPILDDAAAWFVGRVLDRVEMGDHVGHFLEPVDGKAPSTDRPWITFSDVRDLEPGKHA